MKFIVYFCDITYKEDYDYLKRKISDYFKKNNYTF